MVGIIKLPCIEIRFEYLLELKRKEIIYIHRFYNLFNLIVLPGKS